MINRTMEKYNEFKKRQERGCTEPEAFRYVMIDGSKKIEEIKKLIGEYFDFSGDTWNYFLEEIEKIEGLPKDVLDLDKMTGVFDKKPPYSTPKTKLEVKKESSPKDD